MGDARSDEPGAHDEQDEALRASEQHQLAEEDSDADERVVVRDPETGRTFEEQAQ
ncbi:hypothetical protein [Agromyces lapidis]|uniref:Multidrug transporter n=1 Tax=Agromyces lapidis TaxID=279574 RepID=A0ABV5SQ32_9MICO|nr:hypothetical protein [Agromyces lapidis]